MNKKIVLILCLFSFFFSLFIFVSNKTHANYKVFSKGYTHNASFFDESGGSVNSNNYRRRRTPNYRKYFNGGKRNNHDVRRKSSGIKGFIITGIILLVFAILAFIIAAGTKKTKT